MNYSLQPSLRPRNILRKTAKPQLAQTIRDHATDLSSEAVINFVPETDCYVLHRFPWKTGDSYGAIAESYADFTVRHYGQATVVFDGYSEGPSVKDNTHQR